jgi:hypothetical protein
MFIFFEAVRKAGYESCLVRLLRSIVATTRPQKSPQADAVGL